MHDARPDPRGDSSPNRSPNPSPSPSPDPRPPQHAAEPELIPPPWPAFRADPVRVPEPEKWEARLEALRVRRVRLGLSDQQSTVLRALWLLAAAALTFSLLRAGWHRIFLPGWWRP